MGVIVDKNDDIEQKRFIPFSAFYPFFRVLSLFPRFIPFSAFYLFFRLRKGKGSAFYSFSAFYPFFPRFIPFSAFYPFFRVLSLFPRFIPFSAFAIPYFRNSGFVFYPKPIKCLWIQTNPDMCSRALLSPHLMKLTGIL